MPATKDDREVRQQAQRIETLLQEVERFGDPQARERTRQVVEALMDLHGAGLARMLEHIAGAGREGAAIINCLARDELVSSLLLLYGLHPLDLETRVRAALESVRPYLHSHGGNVELLGINEGTIHLRLQGSCHGCPSSALTLKQTIEEAICEKAPDAMGIEVEGEMEHDPAMQGQTIAVNVGCDEPANGRFALPIISG